MSIRQSEPWPGSPDSWPERVRREGNRIRSAFRVRYAETDQMGVAYYANYLVWFEVLRGDFMRAIQLPYTELESLGYFLPIAEVAVRYHAPARYDDVLETTAWLRGVRSRLIHFAYRIERSGQLIATGHTTHVPVGSNGIPRRLSGELIARLAVLVDTVAEAGRLD